eukprot:Em0010g889a
MGKSAALDLSITSPLNPITLPEAGVTAGAAAKATEERKLKANVAKCAALGWVCVPVVAESYGAWGLKAMDFFSKLASRIATSVGNLTSQSGVQQGDPLGPLLFSLVLNVVVKAIATHPECGDLLYHVWYLDDGALAGPSSHVRTALSLLIELGPPLGRHVNIKKCEVFSSGCLTHFPMEMKQSSKPNLEILGIPIGDSVFCRAVLDRKRSEAGVLLKRLDDVGQVDPQVALVLLRLCGGYCKLVHLARAVPPSFSQSVLQLFDQDVQKCFTSCTGVHPSIAAWKQAQLSLSRGGLGLRSLSHHAPAAFIASLCFSGLGSNSHVHLLQSLETFNSSVHQSDNIQIGTVLEKLPSQKTLSSILDNNLFRVLQGSLSIADRARLLSASSPHASSWLTVIPSEGQGLHLDPPVLQTALKWWLGLDTAEGSVCALCPDKMLDPLGHHAATCKRGGDVVVRHNRLRDILAETCRRAHFSVQVEAGCNLTPDHSHSRPADVLISNWALGKTAACDISVTSPLNSNIMSEAGVTAGAAAQATELRKHEASDVKCSELEAMESFSSLASRLAITSSRPKSAVLSELYGRLNLNLAGRGLLGVNSNSHPADVLVDGWERAQPVAFDLTVTSPLTPATLGDACKSTEAAAYTAECRKHSSNDPKCQELGWALAVETYGNWGKEAQNTFSRLASLLSISQCCLKSKIISEIYGRL